ncbi:MAG: AAA family ATPase [Thermoanaerobaculia bacterium]
MSSTVIQGAEEFAGTDRFLVQKQLGSGAFGVVYQVFDRREQSHVALKVLRNADADALYRFKKDFRSLADIRHPNLVSFYELFTEEGLWFFSMELVPGPDFVEYLTGRRCDYSRIRRALRQLALGLHTVHQHGKVHRDIKPSNVLVTPSSKADRDGEDRVVLLDFGLVTELQPTLPLAAEAQLMGTPAYMSPEQALALPSTPASDWYSVGVMLYQVLVGELPFQGSLAEIIAAKQVGLPPNPRQHRADIPDDLEELSVGLLDPDPDIRLPGEEILRRLDQGARAAGGGQGATVLAHRRPGGEVPFVGREALLAELGQALEASRAGAVAVYLRGASGMGKTALVQRFAEDLRQRDAAAVVLLGRCYLQESVPYKAFDSLIDNLSHFLLSLPAVEVSDLLPGHVAELSRLFPVLRRVPAIQQATAPAPEPAEPAVSRRRAFGALRELLARLAEERPLVLVIDDLQWGDTDSFQLLERLFEPPDPPPVLMIACYRSEDEPTSPFLGILGDHRRALIGRGVEVHEIELDSLSVVESQDLIRSLEREGCDVPTDHLAGWIEEAGGSPLFLSELARYSRNQPPVQQPLAGHLRALIQARVDALKPAARRLLQVIAVAGKPLDAEVARQAAAVPSAAGEALAELRTHRLVRQLATVEREEVETYHDQIREAVVGNLGEDSLRRIHRSLALALESSGRAEPETLAVHFRATAEVDRACEYAVSAAERAERALAFERAARLYRQALDLLGDGVDERYRLRVKLGAALANAGRSHEAAEIYLQAVRDAAARPVAARPVAARPVAARPDSGRQGERDLLDVQRLAAEKLLVSGHIDRGLAVLRHVLRHVGMSLEERPWKALLRLWLLRLRLRLRGFRFREKPEAECDPELLRRIDVCWSVEIGLCLVDVLHASEFHARHLLMAMAAGEPQRVARGLAMEIFFGAMEGGDSAAVLELSRRLAANVEGRYPSCLTEMAAGMSACSRGGWSEAHRRLTRAEEQLREIRTGSAWELDTVRHFRVVALLGLGRWRDLFAELPNLLETARARGNLYLEIHLRHWGENLRHLAEDRPERAAELVRETISRWSHQGFHYQHFGRLHAEVEVALYRGRGRSAWRLVETGWGDLAGSMIQRIEMVLVQSHDLRGRATLAAAARENDRRFQAGLVVRAETDARTLERSGSRWSRGLAAMLRAGVAALGGAGDRARGRLVDAEGHFEAARMKVHRAVARRRLAELRADVSGIGEADRELENLGIRNPRSMADVFAPGPWS